MVVFTRFQRSHAAADDSIVITLWIALVTSIATTASTIALWQSVLHGVCSGPTSKYAECYRVKRIQCLFLG